MNHFESLLKPMHTLLSYAIALSQLRAEELGAAEALDSVIGVSSAHFCHGAAPNLALFFFILPFWLKAFRLKETISFVQIEAPWRSIRVQRWKRSARLIQSWVSSWTRCRST
jgi:hypothetical protein